jgi:HD-GYP domain-containing protein (c-di-GMP phosphodiesterase class II)
MLEFERKDHCLNFEFHFDEGGLLLQMAEKKKLLTETMVRIEKNFAAIILSVILITSLVGLVAYRTYIEYRQLKETFTKLNAVVLNHSLAFDFTDSMKRYGYDTEKLEASLKVMDSQSIAQELRKFAEFLRAYEEDLLRRRYSFVMTGLTGLIVLLLFQTFFLHKFRVSLTSFFKKLFSLTQKLIDSLYIDKIDKFQPVEYGEELALNSLIEEVNLRHDLINSFDTLPSVSTIEDFINLVGPKLCTFFKSGRFSLALISEDEVIAEVAYFTTPGHKVLLDKGFKQKLHETSLGKMLADRTRYRIINDLRTVNTESSKLIVEEGFLSNLTVPAIVGGQIIGFLFLSSEEVNHYTERDGKLFYIISTILSPKMYAALTLQNVIANFGISLVDLAEYRDEETGNHIQRVALYSKILAQALNLEPRLVREIYQFAPLHDIGKIGIPDRILLKPGKLNDEERETMKTHVVIGVRVLERFLENSRGIVDRKAMQTAINIVADHHERWDGTGYPAGKKGENISIEGRIVAVADVFDALTTKRPYKNPYPFEESVRIVEENSDKHFDPAVVKAFKDNIDKIYAVYQELRDIEPGEIKQASKLKADNPFNTA